MNTASASGIEHLQTVRGWYAGEEIHENPLKTAFTTPAIQELKLGLYGQDGVTAIRFETLRVTVGNTNSSRARHGMLFH